MQKMNSGGKGKGRCKSGPLKPHLRRQLQHPTAAKANGEWWGRVTSGDAHDGEDVSVGLEGLVEGDGVGVVQRGVHSEPAPPRQTSWEEICSQRPFCSPRPNPWRRGGGFVVGIWWGGAKSTQPL